MILSHVQSFAVMKAINPISNQDLNLRVYKNLRALKAEVTVTLAETLTELSLLIRVPMVDRILTRQGFLLQRIEDTTSTTARAFLVTLAILVFLHISNMDFTEPPKPSLAIMVTTAFQDPIWLLLAVATVSSLSLAIAAPATVNLAAAVTVSQADQAMVSQANPLATVS